MDSSIGPEPQRKEHPNINDLFKNPRNDSPEAFASSTADKRPLRNIECSSSSSPSKRLRLTSDEGKETDEIIFHEGTGQEGSGVGVNCATGGGGDGANVRAATQVAKSASRIALYMMRENESSSAATAANIASGKEKNKDNTIQHTHDFFVISSCTVNTRFQDRIDVHATGEKRVVLVPADSRHPTATQVDRKKMPGDMDAAEKILRRFGVNIDGRSNTGLMTSSKMCVPKDTPDFAEWLGRQESGMRGGLRSTFDFVCSKEESGATGRQLKTLGDVEMSVMALVDAHMLIR
jgi:hypothetical protein